MSEQKCHDCGRVIHEKACCLACIRIWQTICVCLVIAFSVLGILGAIETSDLKRENSDLRYELHKHQWDELGRAVDDLVEKSKQLIREYVRSN